MDNVSAYPPIVKLNVVKATVLDAALGVYVEQLQRDALNALVVGDMDLFHMRMTVLNVAFPLWDEMHNNLPANAREDTMAYFRRAEGRCEECGSKEHVAH